MTKRDLYDAAVISIANVNNEVRSAVTTILGRCMKDPKGHIPVKDDPFPIKTKTTVANTSHTFDFYFNIMKPRVLNGKDRITRRIYKSKKFNDYQLLVDSTAKKNGLPANLIAAILHQESAWDKDAKAGGIYAARGIAQFTLNTARDLGLKVDKFEGGIDERTDTTKAITAMGAYLKSLSEKYNGDLSKVITAYHEGPTGADRIFEAGERGHGGDVLTGLMYTNKHTGQKELLDYVPNVLAYMREYR